MATGIPTTVVTGSLGAGKTTVILNLIKQLPKEYQTIWLKNEYGDVNVDSELAKASNIQTTEILNGCLCCVLVGRLHDALEEIAQKYHPDRLIIETAGTAYPYPIVAQVNQVDGVDLDGLITVVDAVNFDRFADKSPLAREQAKYVDLVVINKAELVEADQLEHVMDEVYDMYLNSPKVKSEEGYVNKDLLIGIDTPQSSLQPPPSEHHHHHHSDEVETFGFHDTKHSFDTEKITKMLTGLDSIDYYRIKGIIKSDAGFKLLNYVAGRIDWQDIDNYDKETKVTFMGKGIRGQELSVKEKLNECIIN